MSEKNEKFNSINIITHINEIICQTEVTQYFKNTQKSPIELEIELPKLSDCNITKFEMIKNNKKVISQLLEKEKAKEKYSDTISTGNYGFISYNEDNKNKVCLGNIAAGEEIELKTFYFSHIINKDLSYQAIFPTIFPNFIMGDPDSKETSEKYDYNKEIVKGKIYINTRSKITRLVIKGSKNFSKIEKKFGIDNKTAEIDIFKDNFSDKDIPGIVLFRTEKINDEILYYQNDPKKNKTYYMLQKTLNKPEFTKEFKNEIDEDENLDYHSLVKYKEEKEEEKDQQNQCYIFLLDQSGSMSGERINLSCKSLLLFLQSLNKNCFFQLIGFGSNFEFFSEKPLEYNKENVKNLMDTIKNLRADKGGTELYEPLNKIYTNKIYDDYDMKKNIILLTDGELFDKEKVINLIGANSSQFTFNSIGIGDCDKDLIERTALMGKGYSYYISELGELNSVVISLLEKTQNFLEINCSTNQKCLIQDDNKKIINRNDYFTHAFIIDGINLNNIEFIIKIKNDEIKINFDKNKMIKLPDGDNLGKLIVYNYLKSKKCKDQKMIIKLSKEYNILTDETAFYAKMTNEVPVTEKMIKMTNKDKTASNNTIKENKEQNIIKEDDYIYNDEIFGYDNIEEETQQKKGFFSNLFSKIFHSDNIIKKKNFVYKEKPQKKEKRIYDDYCCYDLASPDYNDCFECGAMPDDDYDGKCDYAIDLERKHSFDDDDEEEPYEKTSKEVIKSEKVIKKEKEEIKDEIVIKKEFNFDEFILGQDVLDGNWTKNTQIEILIEQEKDNYEKIKKYSEDKGIKEENGIFTLFALYYIFNKKKDKINELKFVINKAKAYVKKIFNSEYDEIIKEIEAK